MSPDGGTFALKDLAQRTRKFAPPVVALGTPWRGQLASPYRSITPFGVLTNQAAQEDSIHSAYGEVPSVFSGRSVFRKTYPAA
jgi:hypothetical protein